MQTEPREQREQCELAHALPSRVRGRHMSTQSSLLELPRCSLSYVNKTTDLSDWTDFFWEGILRTEILVTNIREIREIRSFDY